MLVERTVKDRYLSALFYDTTTGSDVGVEIILAARPQNLRVRRLVTSCKGGAQVTTGSQIWFALVIVPGGTGPGPVNIPASSGDVFDLYEPASNVIWSSMHTLLDNNAGTGPGIGERVWEGDGKVIALNSGDRIYWVLDSAGDTVEFRSVLDMDILS